MNKILIILLLWGAGCTQQIEIVDVAWSDGEVVAEFSMNSNTFNMFVENPTIDSIGVCFGDSCVAYWRRIDLSDTDSASIELPSAT